MKIQVESLGLPTLSKLIGKRVELEMDGGTLADLVEHIINRSGREARKILLDHTGELDMTIQLMLNEVGFEIRPFGGNSYLIRAVPAIVAASDPRSTLEDVLEYLRRGDDPLASQAEERLVAAVCKRGAIKSGQTLSQEEMQQLVRDLEQCASPRTCPHGRPTVLHFAVEQLEKEFGRR